MIVNFPSEGDAIKITESVMSVPVEKLERFCTGNHHFVYDVLLENGENVVTRISLPSEQQAMEGAIYWSQLLKPIGVPLPDILDFDVTCKSFSYPYLILQRIPGTDLRYEYGDMSDAQRLEVVSHLVDIQQKVFAKIPTGRGFGYVDRLDVNFPYDSWKLLINNAISITRSRIMKLAVFEMRSVEILESLSQEFSDYFDKVKPIPFLHDMTSKNVMIKEGKLTGIVDVDSLCFGDPLYLPGLIQAAFIADDLPDDYIEYWKEALNLNDYQRRIVSFYAIQHLSYIMGELGLQQNQNTSGICDKAEIERLQQALNQLTENIINSRTKHCYNFKPL